jgi:hypothetical protein
MNSRRFTSNFSRASTRKIALRETYRTAGFRRSFCTLWVIHVIPAIPACSVRPKSGHSANARAYEGTPKEIEAGAALANCRALRLTIKSRIDVYPGESEPLDVAVRLDDDVQCFGWNNESYFRDDWRNRDWELPPGRYLVKAMVVSSAQKCFGIFCLINDGHRDTFRLEPPTPEQAAAVKQMEQLTRVP